MVTNPDTESSEGMAADEDEIEGYEAPRPGGWQEYPIDELAIRDERRTAVDVVRRIGQGRFVLDPDFQRAFVWDKDKQSRLIESILMRIPLPVFYVAEDSKGRLIVVDGRQRLTTLQRFFSGELRLELSDRPDLNGKRFSELDVRYQNRLEDCQLHFYIIDHSVPERARLDIFERVNGGEVLTRQQMRNAIFSGPATRFLAERASTPLFVDATGRSLSSDRMQDREFVNRFCSFWMFDLSKYRGDMDEWLARSLNVLNSDPSKSQKIADALQRGLKNNLTVFGKHAFRKHKDASRSRSRINASLFDVMMSGLCSVEEPRVVERANQLRTEFYGLMDNQRFIRSITYGPNAAIEVRTRFEITRPVFARVFG